MRTLKAHPGVRRHRFRRAGSARPTGCPCRGARGGARAHRRRPVAVAGAGRTDAGVHATGRSRARRRHAARRGDAATRAERDAARGRPGARRRGGGPRLPRALRRRLEDLSLSHRRTAAWPCPVPAALDMARAVAARRRGDAGRGAAPRRGARFRGVPIDRHRRPHVGAHGSTCPGSSRRSTDGPARARRSARGGGPRDACSSTRWTGRRVPPAHGPRDRRHARRGRARPGRAVARRRAAGRRTRARAGAHGAGSRALPGACRLRRRARLRLNDKSL